MFSPEIGPKIDGFFGGEKWVFWGSEKWGENALKLDCFWGGKGDRLQSLC